MATLKISGGKIQNIHASFHSEWIKRLQQHGDFKNLDFVYPFFGQMNKDEVGVFAYKHADHHLRQFGV